MKSIKIAPEVVDILRRSTIDGTQLFLPGERLTPKLYKAVNEVIQRIGGEWSRSAQAHVFSSNPKSRLEKALETGVATFDLSVAPPKVAEAFAKKENQAYYTPRDLALQIATFAKVQDCSVLEPSSGMGALALACRDMGADSVQCIERVPASAEYCRKLGFNTIEANFLGVTPDKKYDRVVMNPPFTKNQDVKHVAHALQFLKSGGILVSIMPDNQRRRAFKALSASCHHYSVMQLPGYSFIESGTGANTIALRICL